MRVIGIDPGTRVTGYGIVEHEAGRPLAHIAHGVIRTKASDALWDRLKRITDGLREVLAAYPVDSMAMERCFVSKNVSSALKLGHTRGAIMVVGLEAGASIAEYAPSEIKSAVTGSGRADKHQVAQMVRVVLNLAEAASSDASDALAAAICHIHADGFRQQLRAAPGRSRRRR